MPNNTVKTKAVKTIPNGGWYMQEEKKMVNNFTLAVLTQYIASLNLRANWGKLDPEKLKTYANNRLAKLKIQEQAVKA